MNIPELLTSRSTRPNFSIACLEQLQYLPLVRQVRLHHEHLRPEAPKLLGGRLQVVPVPGRGGQIGPIPSECSRDPLPDPGARPRNDSYLPFKLSHISSLRGPASTPYMWPAASNQAMIPKVNPGPGNERTKTPPTAVDRGVDRLRGKQRSDTRPLWQERVLSRGAEKLDRQRTNGRMSGLHLQAAPGPTESCKSSTSTGARKYAGSNRREAIYQAAETRIPGMVGKPGLEPGRLAAHDPKSCSSTSSDTPPQGPLRSLQDVDIATTLGPFT